MTIEERLDRLERQNRALRNGMLAVVVVAGAFLLLGQDDPGEKKSGDEAENGVVEARGFVVKDEKGFKRIELKADSDNLARMVIWDKEGAARLYLGEAKISHADISDSGEVVSAGAYGTHLYMLQKGGSTQIAASEKGVRADLIASRFSRQGRTLGLFA